MEIIYETKARLQDPIHGRQKCFISGQVLFRSLAVAAAMVATWLMATSKQSTEFFGIQIRAVYSDSPDFKFFVYANGIACVSSLVSLLTVYVLYRKGSNPSNYFYVFLHDLIIMALVMAASVAASAIGYVGAYGNTHTGWMSICDQVDKFCHRASDSIIFSYLAFFIYLILTVLSANESRQIQV